MKFCKLAKARHVINKTSNLNEKLFFKVKRQRFILNFVALIYYSDLLSNYTILDQWLIPAIKMFLKFFFDENFIDLLTFAL